MERKMNYNLMLSLKDICIRRVVVILWTHPDSIASIHGYAVENYVMSDMWKLELPPLLTERMMYAVEPIKYEITDWIFFHASYLKISYENMYVHVPLLCWTNLGTVDYRKSAERMIRYKMFDALQCYKLACLYCLDGYISVLWEELSEESKRQFYKEEGPSGDTELSLEFCWPYILKEEETKLNNVLERSLGYPTNFNQYAFEYSARKGNKTANEYFFQKLTNSERETLLFRTVQAILTRQSDNVIDCPDFYLNRTRNDNFWYLLSLLSPEQQVEIFKEYSFTVLMNSLQWPWQDISMDLAELIWPYLTAQEYSRSLQNISSRIKSGFNLSKVFQELFLQGPSDFKTHFVDLECHYGVSLRSFFKVHDSETMKIIFRALDYVDRKRLIYSKRVLRHFYKSILRGNCDMVKLCIQEAKLSTEDKEGLKKVFYIFYTEIENDLKNRTKMFRRFISKIKESEVPSGSLTETEMDAKCINRKEYIWEQFILIVDEGGSRIPLARSLDEEDTECRSSNSDFDEDIY